MASETTTKKPATTPPPDSASSPKSSKPDSPPSKSDAPAVAAAPAVEESADEADDSSSSADAADCVDMETFNQILDLDDESDESRAFSREMAWSYFTQARETFVEIEDALEKKDLVILKDKGHFLKGSSATLGISKVQDICEIIQNSAKDAVDFKKISDDEALKTIGKVLPDGKKEYEIAEKWLKTWYRENTKFDEDEDE